MPSPTSPNSSLRVLSAEVIEFSEQCREAHSRQVKARKALMRAASELEKLEISPPQITKVGSDSPNDAVLVPLFGSTSVVVPVYLCKNPADHRLLAIYEHVEASGQIGEARHDTVADVTGRDRDTVKRAYFRARSRFLKWLSLRDRWFEGRKTGADLCKPEDDD